MSWTWKWFDLLIVIMALAVGFGVWFIPNFMASDEMKALVASQNKLKAEVAAYEKEVAAYDRQQAEIKREQEELGLVFLPPPPARAEKPGAKPAQKAAAKPAPQKDK